MDRFALILCLGALALTAVSCQEPAPQPGEPRVTVAIDPRRDEVAAREANDRGAELLTKGKLDEAAKQFQKAIAAHPFFGPAHNNLGAVYELQKRFYPAALSYQQAAKLMPKQAEPVNNLGMVMEKTMRLEEAVRHYRDALELDPKNPIITGNLARVYARMGKRDGEYRDLLMLLVARDQRPEWQEWAREQLVLMAVTTQPSTQPTTIPAGIDRKQPPGPKPPAILPLD